MRIALFHNAPSGGAKRAIYEWTRRLADNHEIDVYTVSSADHEFCDIRPFVQKHRVFDFEPLPLFDSPWGRLNQLQRWRDLGRLAQLGRRIAEAINAQTYDVVFAHTCLHTVVPTCLQFIDAPTVYYLHEPLGKTFVRHIERPYFKSNGWRAWLDRRDPLIVLYRQRLDTVQRQSVLAADRLLANSQFTRQQIKVDFDVDAPVCYLGVDTDQFAPIADCKKEDFVLSVGELTPRKGFDFLVESLTCIRTSQRPILKIACNTVSAEEQGYIQELAERHGVQLEVHVRLGVEQLRVEYNKARLCVYAPVLEPFGLVPLEAMACGTPVIGAREGGVQESIIHEQTGLLADRDAKQFAAAIYQMLSNPSLLDRYGHNAREHVLRNWSWSKSTTALERHLLDSVTT